MKKNFILFFLLASFGPLLQSQVIFSEDFSSAATGSNNIGTLPTGWIAYGDSLTNNSNYSSFNNSWQVYNYDGNKMALSVSYVTSGRCNRWLVSPQIAVPATGNYGLVFTATGYSDSYPEELRIMASTTDSAQASFTELTDLTAGEGEHQFYVSLAAYAGQTIRLAFVSHGDGYYVFLDDIEVKNVPTNSIALLSASVLAYAAMGDNIQPTLTVMNTGSDTLRSFTYTYRVNGGSPISATATGLSIAPYAIADVPAATYVHAVADTITINYTVSLPNGTADPDTIDNTASCSVTVYNPAYTATRTLLLEDFETTPTIYTPVATNRLTAAVNGSNHQDRVVWITHHVGYFNDNLTIDESNSLLGMYGSSSTFCPAMMIDRNVDNSIRPNANSVIGSVGDENEIPAQLAAALNVPALVSVNITNMNYNAQTRELALTVSGEFTNLVNIEHPSVSLYLTEDSIVMAQQEYTGSGTITNQNYIHNHVLRACITGVWGDTTVITSTAAGSTFSHTYTYTLPSNFNAEHCHVVAFVSNVDNRNIFNRQVLNATMAAVSPVNDNTFQVTAVSSDVALGTVQGGGIYTAGDQAEVSVFVHGGAQFLGWSNGSTANPYTFTVTQNLTLTANLLPATAQSADTVFIAGDTVFFYDTVRIVDTVHLAGDTVYIYDTIRIVDTIYVSDTVNSVNVVDALNVKLYADQGQLVVEGAEGARVMLYDAVGRMLAVRQDEYDALRFDVPVSGTYLVRVGNHAARRVVVIR